MKKSISIFSKRLLTLGITGTGVVCAVYILGLFSGAVYTYCAYDAIRYAKDAAEIFFCCLAVAIGGALAKEIGDRRY